MDRSGSELQLQKPHSNSAHARGPKGLSKSWLKRRILKQKLLRSKRGLERADRRPSPVEDDRHQGYLSAESRLGLPFSRIVTSFQQPAMRPASESNIDSNPQVLNELC